MRAFLLFSSIAAAVSLDIIVNDFDAGFECDKCEEGWYSGCADDAFGDRPVDFHVDMAGDRGLVRALYSPTLPKDGCWAISEHHPGARHSCSRYLPRNANLRIYHTAQDGRPLSSGFTIDQSTKGGQWNTIGEFMLVADQTNFVEYNNAGGSSQCDAPGQCWWVADAFKFTFVGDSCNSDGDAPEIALVPNAAQQNCGFFLEDLHSAIEACESDVDVPAEPDLSSMLEGIRGAIAAGVPLWNAGDVAGCVDVYSSFAMAHQQLDGRLGEALGKCVGKAAKAQGWILRHAFDRILALPHIQPASSDVSTVLDGIRAAIREGVPLWNAGDVAGCVDVYSSFAMAHQQLDGRLGEALGKCVGQAAKAQGWILRHAFDRILVLPQEAPRPPTAPAAGPDAVSCETVRRHPSCKRAARGLAEVGRERFMPCMSAAVASGAIDQVLHPRTEAILACPLFAEAEPAEAEPEAADALRGAGAGESPSPPLEAGLKTREWDGNCDAFLQRASQVLEVCGKPDCCADVIQAPECEYSANALFAVFPPTAFEQCSLPRMCQDRAVRLAAACATQAEVHRVLYREEWVPDACASTSSGSSGDGSGRSRLSRCTLLVAAVALGLVVLAACLGGVWCGRKRAEVAEMARADRVVTARVCEVQPTESVELPVGTLLEGEAAQKKRAMPGFEVTGLAVDAEGVGDA